MSSSKEKVPAYEEVIADLLRSTTGPVSAKELAEKLLAVRPSQARNPLQAMRQHIRQANGRLLVFLDADTVLSLRLAFQGARFRLPLDREMINKGLVNIVDSLPYYLPLNFPLEQVRFVDSAGKPVAFQIKPVSQQVNTLFGHQDITTLYANLSDWLRAQKVNAKDHLLITILDWEQGVMQLAREPFGQRNQGLLAQRNRLMADLFFDLLESAVDEDIYAHVAVPTIYARLPDKSGYPPGHWMIVLEEDGRMISDGWRIHYSDGGFSPLEQLAREIAGEPQHPAARPVSKEQREQVYRFKAALAYRPNLWREIEVQGKQTLADLDLLLREAFNHDVFDHLGGFWKLIPRGIQGKPGVTKRGAARQARYREVKLGHVEPMGGGEGARIRIAELELAIGDRLKYVYDFGDWIEHHLTLEAIETPQASVKYPREVARNQPEYVYCVECQKKGKQKVAKWICLECTTGPDHEIMLCEKCADRHEEHYLEEILY
ncbi:MAG: plasmid pRiA4b ORF-3 family protein [Chloroflexi bacterium]|nr:plasmid pRiA4b ORF-3 family protein [Chloroflexota bacterium]